MKTSLSIVTRDALRLWRIRKVWVIVLGVMITPAFYAWVNIAAFWDPYGNTENISVAVVNEDRGAGSKLTGDLDVGTQMIAQLKKNNQLGWQFMDADSAKRAVNSGDVFASVTVPPSFSADIISIFQGRYSQPTLQYEVNEKTSAIGPKITDQGATGIENQINSAFKEQVSNAITAELRKSGGELSTTLNNTSDSAADSLTETAESLRSAQADITAAKKSVTSAGPTIDATTDALESVDKTLGDAERALRQVLNITGEVQRKTAAVSDSVNAAYFQGSSSLNDAVTSAMNAVSSVTGDLESAGSGIDDALGGASGVVDQSDRAIDQLQQLLDGGGGTTEAAAPLTDALNGLRERNATNRQLVTDLTGLKDAASDTAGTVTAAANALENATLATRDSSDDLRSSVGETLPVLNSAINELNASAGGYSSALASQQTLVRESIGLLDGTGRQLSAANGVLDSFIGDLSGIEDGLRTAQSDILLLNAASGDGPLGTVSNLDSEGISQFFASPAEVVSHPVFPVSSYGSGMAALFTNLALWVGSFMLVVLFRTEVDTAGLKRASITQAYSARFLLLAIIAVGQALVVSIGNLVLDVQTVNPVVFVATCALIGLAYLSIVFALVTAFGHIGRGIAVVLAFIQIPGASGIYPIEMVPDFFRDIYPFLPFTYGIGALRETIGGFYGTHYWHDMGLLVGMAAAAFVFGTLFRRGLSHVKVLVHTQLADGGLVVHEKVELTGSKYPLSDIIHALRDRDDFREKVDRRWKPLRDHYPALLRSAILIGVVGVVILVFIARTLPEQKAILFGLVCLWILVITAFVSILEYARHSFARAQQLADLPDDELRRAVTSTGTDEELTYAEEESSTNNKQCSSERASTNRSDDNTGGDS
ncbi:YhgE/Pip domain-containing protein [Dietzia sp.]|uniref:YhgE/Pip domain-containing protein n=1 Tax=Dietzia sp. TaxID=1871616 RepID=UPI002FD9B763